MLNGWEPFLSERGLLSPTHRLHARYWGQCSPLALPLFLQELKASRMSAAWEREAGTSQVFWAHPWWQRLCQFIWIPNVLHLPTYSLRFREAPWESALHLKLETLIWVNKKGGLGDVGILLPYCYVFVGESAPMQVQAVGAGHSTSRPKLLKLWVTCGIA